MNKWLTAVSAALVFAVNPATTLADADKLAAVLAAQPDESKAR